MRRWRTSLPACLAALIEARNAAALPALDLERRPAPPTTALPFVGPGTVGVTGTF